MARLTPELSNRVAQARLAAGLTQEQLAAAIEVSRQTVGAIEKGEYNPSTALALRLSAVLSTSVEALFWLPEKTAQTFEARGAKVGVSSRKEAEADANSSVVA